MRYGTSDLAFDLLLLVFWFRLWNREDRALFLDPYLAPVNRFTLAVVNFLRPALPGAPARLVALAAFAFVLLFRALAYRALDADALTPWTIGLGLKQAAAPPGLASYFSFSVLAFAVFLFKLWAFSLLFVPGRPGHCHHSPAETVCHVSRPFTDARVEWRPALLLAFGLAIGAVLEKASPSDALPGGLLRQGAALGLSALAAWVRVLPAVLSFMMLLIVGSWVSLFAGSPPIMVFCQDWLSLLLGPFRRFQLRLGAFDLTPIVVVLAVQYVVYPVCLWAILSAYNRLF